MALDRNNLSALTYANGFTLWHYKTQDWIYDVKARSYFNDAAGMLRVGDFIFVNATGFGGVLVVTENFEGMITVQSITDAD